MNEKSSTDGMESTGFDEKRIAIFRGDGVHKFRDRAVGDGLLEAFAGSAAFEADVEFGPRQGIGDEPHFGFRFAAELFCDGCGWVDLNGE
jgi:hypothetical protein